jgi:glycerol-3-phosphate acyltransferase PlsY
MIVLLLSAYISLASMLAFICVALLSLVPQLDSFYLVNNEYYNAYIDIVSYNHYWISIISLCVLLLFISTIIIIRHIPNIKKIIDNNESKVSKVLKIHAHFKKNQTKK